MATIYVDNRPYTVNPKQNLLFNCLSLGFNLPYFCWHPAMGSVGACRQCAVKQFKDETDQRGKLVMACMTAAAEGTRISIEHPEAVAFRRGVIEGLMENHPHDCPVCDEGGECHLQDMTYMTGHDYRRYRFQKRTFRNQYLGPFVNHEFNRCIQCYRCLRFYREYAGGKDFNAFAIHDTVFFGRDADGVLESPFAGNLVEVCPTGVFTDATFKHHYTRKWDLQAAPSVCVHCGVGCNTSPGERYGVLRRVQNRYNDEVNRYFLCDRGRYGYEFVNSPRRVRQARLRGEPIGRAAALEQLVRGAREGRIAGIGSPRASLESNFALRRMVGPGMFFSGMSDPEGALVRRMLSLLRAGPRTPSLREIESCDAVLVLGEDVANTAPRLALSLRQSVRQQPLEIAATLKIPLWPDHAVREAVQGEKGPFYVATPANSSLDDVATALFRGAPDEIARLGFEVAQAVSSGPDGPNGLPHQIANDLRTAKRPLVVSGAGCGSAAVIEAAAAVARALPHAVLAFTAPECNSFGLGMMQPKPLGEALHDSFTTVVVLENDLYRRAPAGEVDAFLARARNVVVLDSLESATTAAAELLLPAASFAEGNGTLVNSEGRAQRFFQVLETGEEGPWDAWRWLADPAWERLDDVIAALTAEMDVFAAAAGAAPPSDFRIAGQRVARQPHRYSGRTAMHAQVSVHEPVPPEDPDSPLAFSMEGAPVQPPSALVPFFWKPGWNSIRATTLYQVEVAAPLRGGPPGARLIEPQGRRAQGPSGEIPPPFTPRAGEYFAVPLHHIYGSEELSLASPPVAELAPHPYVALSASDAGQLRASPGDTLDVTIEGAVYHLPLLLRPELSMGLAGLPAGLPPLAGLRLPAWIRIARA